MKKNNLVQKKYYLHKLLTRLDVLRKSGEFQSLTYRKRKELLRRTRRLYKQVVSGSGSFNAKPALMAVVAALGLGAGNVGYAQPSFDTVQVNPFMLQTVNGEAKPAYVDIDADGDLDLFVGDNDNGKFNFFLNSGTSTAPAFDSAQVNPFGLTDTYGYSSPTFADLDNDGDMDMISGEAYLHLWYFENVGDSATPNFAPAAVDTFNIDFTSYSEYETKPHLQDMDSDGDFDLLVGIGYKEVLYFENTGTMLAPMFDAPVAGPFGLATFNSYYLAPTTVDIDLDGDFDLFVADNTGEIFYFENTGTPMVPIFTAMGVQPFGIEMSYDYSGPIFADLDGDGDMDFTVGDSDGRIRYQPDTSTFSVAPRVMPPSDTTTCDTGTVGPLPFTVTDPQMDPVTVSGTSSDQAVLPDANITVSGTAPNLMVTANPISPGLATITLTANDGTYDGAGTFDLTVDSCAVGIAESFFVQQFDLYPNPASSTLHLDLKLFDPAKGVRYEVHDLFGRTLFTDVLAGTNTHFTTEIAVTAYPAGVYLLQVHTGNLRFTRRFVVE